MSHAPKPPITAPRGTPQHTAQVNARRAWHRQHGGVKKKKDPTSSSDEQGEVSDEEEKNEREEKARLIQAKNLHNIQQYILSQNINAVNTFYNSNKNLFAYRMFRQIMGPSSKIVTKLRGLPDLSPLFNIPNSVLSLLHPKIKIYRVTYEETASSPDEIGIVDDLDMNAIPDSDVTATKMVPYLTPCYREFKFSDNFGSETAASPEDYLAYESSKASWRNIGLQSFEVKQIGKSDGLIEQNLECSLKLNFKNLKDIVASPPGEPPVSQGGLRYVDLILHPGAKIDKETSEYNPSHYDLKVLVGYEQLNPEQVSNIAGDLTENQTRRLLENLSKLNVVYGLSLRNYSFDIKDNGSVDLTANYWGRIDSTLGNISANIFQQTFIVNDRGNFVLKTKADIEDNIPSLSRLSAMIKSIYSALSSAECKEDCRAKNQLSNLRKENKMFQAILKEASEIEFTTDDELNKWMKEADNANLLITILSNKSATLKDEVYASFMTQLIDGNVSEKGSRLFCASADKDIVLEAMGYLKSAQSARKNKKKDVTSKDFKQSTSMAIGKASETLDISKCDENMSEKTAEAKNATAAKITNSLRSESKSKDPASGESTSDVDEAVSSILDASGDTYKYYFVFLGDIIELACKNAGLRGMDFPSSDSPYVYARDTYVMNTEKAPSYPFRGMRMLLGPVEYFDREGILQRINLAQFPISFDLFRDWFLRTIVAKRKIRMPVGSFITKLVNQVVIPSLGTKFIRPARPRGTRSQSINLTLPGRSIQGSKVTVCGRETPMTTELLPLQRVIDVESGDFDKRYYDKVEAGIGDESFMRTSYDYWLLQVSTVKDMIKRSGDAKEDLQDGIYHFNIGQDSGLLKNMKFTKSELEGLPEARSKEAIEGGGDQLAQLREPYDCNVTLIGNTLFTPGMMFYANPSLLGLGNPQASHSLAHTLNLGGYFAIMTTKLVITPGKFETKLEGKTQGRSKMIGR